MSVLHSVWSVDSVWLVPGRPVTDWKGVDGVGGGGLLLVLDLPAGPARLLEIEMMSPNTEQLLLPGLEQMLVMLVVAVASQTDGQQRHEVRH